jgi:Tfp pilus assembly protein PilX
MRTQLPFSVRSLQKQAGVSLFIALIALLALMLAALALIRSVDTSTLIAGNLAFKQAATSSANLGTEAAIADLNALQLANANPTPWDDPTHVLNNTNAANGYYANIDPLLDLKLAPHVLGTPWVNGKSKSSGAADAAGNSSRYIIQRMCRQLVATPDNTPLNSTNCLLNAARPAGDEKSDAEKAVKPSNNVTYRVTVRVTGPRNTESFVQIFIY